MLFSCIATRHSKRFSTWMDPYQDAASMIRDFWLAVDRILGE